MEGGGSILEVTGLEKSYGRNKVLKGVDLTVRKGEVIAIIGPSFLSCNRLHFVCKLIVVHINTFVNS